MKTSALITGIIAVFLSVSSYAGNTTANTQASASLIGVCELAVTDMPFGKITPGQNAEANSTVSVNCTQTSNYTIDFAYGNAGGSHLEGQVSGDWLPYIVQILQTGSYLTISNITGAGTGQVQNYGLKGYILQAEDQAAPHIVPYVTPDNYNDTITATVSF